MSLNLRNRLSTNFLLATNEESRQSSDEEYKENPDKKKFLQFFTNYDYYFMIKKLAKEFKGKNTKKLNLFSCQKKKRNSIKTEKKLHISCLFIFIDKIYGKMDDLILVWVGYVDVCFEEGRG